MEVNSGADEYEHFIPDVMYVPNNIPGPGIDMDDFEMVYSVGCTCGSEQFACSDRSNCSCTRGSNNYIDGCILNDKVTEPILECNSYCSCGLNCGNRVVQIGPLKCLLVKKTGEKGLGLVTSKSIKKGQFICEYAGEIISVQEAKRRFESNANNKDMNYVLVVYEHIGDKTITTCIDPKYFGNIGRYANHSCEPNSRLVPVRVEGVIPRLCLFALRNIEIGEEVTFDYANSAADSAQCHSQTPCLCKSDTCRGYLPHNPI